MNEAFCIGRRIARASLLAGLAMVFMVCAAGGAPVPGEAVVPATTIAAGDASMIHTPTQAVVREQDAWADLWRRHSGRADAPPAVDFGRDMIIAVFAGDSSEPVALSIARIVRESNRLVVAYTLAATRPMADAVGPVVAPFHIVRVARSSLPVTFVLLKVPQVFHHGS